MNFEYLHLVVLYHVMTFDVIIKSFATFNVIVNAFRKVWESLKLDYTQIIFCSRQMKLILQFSN
jgi:hypothetical protein